MDKHVGHNPNHAQLVTTAFQRAVDFPCQRNYEYLRRCLVGARAWAQEFTGDPRSGVVLELVQQLEERFENILRVMKLAMSCVRDMDVSGPPRTVRNRLLHERLQRRERMMAGELEGTAYQRQL